MSNAFEQVGRLRKVAALVRVMRLGKITASEAETRMEPHDWIAAAEAARVNPPSLDTIAAVIAELWKDEAVNRLGEGRRDCAGLQPRDEDTFPDETSWGPTAAQEIQDPRRRR